MRIFLTGANGYIGGSAAATFIAAGHTIRGLVRDQAKADLVAAKGITPVIGTLDDLELLREEARAAEAVVNTASSDHRPAVEAILAGLAGSGKPFFHTSGSSIVADEAMGEPSDRIFYEDTPIDPVPGKAARVAIDRLILGAGGIVICNTMIYGNAHGAESVQIPALVKHAKQSGIARYIGRGLNRWSNAHIADVAALYPLVLVKAAPGTFMYIESGEESLINIVRAIATRFDLGEPQSWPPEEAIAALGHGMAAYSLGSNSRVRGRIAAELGWTPRHRSVTDWIKHELPG